ncbi:sacsin N-terminal ATP-binding-like domain-containing protein [Nannocystaceae bacterium ST9]
MSERSASDFRERARVEADRYGPDPWIFVRELLQNARDAGARTVAFAIEEGTSGTRIRCRDDGEGMSYEHARRYLFSLYASSKEDRANQVGRFGVGFWSILRFDPARIVIRSRPRPQPGKPSEPGWQVVLDGALQQAERSTVEMEPGTEVLLERAAGDGSDARRVWEAALQNARYLCQRDAPDLALPVLIDGRPINAEFTLPAPSASFRRGRVRGVVGLGSAPRVELFSRGLRVRSAACLDDLLTSSGHTGHSRVRFPELPGGLAPQALLESDGLDLLLSRSDARDTRALRRLVKLGQNELRSLVERQLARIRPPGIGERVAGLLRRLVGESTWWRALLGATTGALLAALLAQLIWPASERPIAEAESGASDLEDTDETDRPSRRRAYSDLSRRYDGPQVSELDAAGAEPLALRYAPSDAHPYFAALVIQDVGGSAGAEASASSPRYPSWRCASECLSVELPILAGPGTLPLLMPTGHRLALDSLRFVDEAGREGERPIVLVDDAGQPALLLGREFAGTLHYTSGPGPALDHVVRERSVLTGSLRRDARKLRTRPARERIDAAIDLVRDRVRYSTKRDVAEQHDRAKRAGKPFVDRALEIGAGDCDVQNGLLVAVLHEAEIDARLAVGWVGDRGGVSPWLHAWVEWMDPAGRWSVADATGRELEATPSLAGLPPSPNEVAVGTLRPAPDPGGPAEPTSASEPLAEPDPITPIRDEARLRDASEPASSAIPPELLAWLDRPWLAWAAMASALLGIGLLGVSLTGRTARRIQLDEGGDLSSLLQGALAQPGAFRHLPSLFHRRLIPVRGGSAISLQRARTLASRGRLYVGREQTELSRTARRRGIAVLDGDSPEGRTVAASLAATDLDRWGHRIARSQDTPLLQALAQHLREHGERWWIASIRGLGAPVETLDLRPLGARARLGERLVLIDAEDPFMQETERLRASRPHTAAFTLLDHLLDHLDLGPQRRAALLAPLADRALQEAARG